MLQAFYMAFYSDRLYADVGRRWRGMGLGYLLLLAGICWSIAVGNWLVTLARVDFSPERFNHEKFLSPEENTGITGAQKRVYHTVAHIMAQMPVITIHKGKASVDVPVPHTVYFPGTVIPLMEIDTSGKTKSLQDTSAVVLLTEGKLFIRKDQTTESVHALSTLDDQVINTETLQQWMQEGKKSLFWILPAVFLPIETLVSLLWLVVLTTVYGWMAWVIGKFFRVRGLQFPDFFRIACVASTPMVIFSTLTVSVPFFGAFVLKNDIVAVQPLPAYSGWGVVVTLLYIIFAVVSNRGAAATGEE